MLYYGNKYWGITEANYLLVLLHCGTGYFGPHIWRADVTSHLSSFLDMKIPVTLRVNDCLLMGIACFALSYCMAAFYRVLKDEKVSPSHLFSLSSNVELLFRIHQILEGFEINLSAVWAHSVTLAEKRSTDSKSVLLPIVK